LVLGSIFVVVSFSTGLNVSEGWRWMREENVREMDGRKDRKR